VRPLVLVAFVAGATLVGDRFDVLRQYPWPAFTAAGLASGMRWMMLALALSGAYVAWNTRARIRSSAADPRDPRRA
jgi:Na+-transporting NADH:ubiquinone oxidoreductase subunit NqrE